MAPSPRRCARSVLCRFCAPTPTPNVPPNVPNSPLPPCFTSPLGSPLLPPAARVPQHVPGGGREGASCMQQRQAQTANPWAESSMPTFAPAADGPQPTVMDDAADARRAALAREKGELSGEREAQQRRRRETPEVKYTRVQDAGHARRPPAAGARPRRPADADRALDKVEEPLAPEFVAPLPTMTNGGGALGATSADGRRRRRRQRRDAGDAEHAEDDGRRHDAERW